MASTILPIILLLLYGYELIFPDRDIILGLIYNFLFREYWFPENIVSDAQSIGFW